MVGRKVRNLIILSRSGPNSPQALDLLDELREKKVNVAVPECDVSNETVLLTALASCSQSMPPVKGCIQASMVVRDGMFENVSWENLRAAFTPKVEGSWNLHIHLPRNLDFFVMLSSIGGVFGSTGQSSYSAANTYQDSLARHRVAKGEKAISIDLGLVLQIGYAAERQEVIEQLKYKGYKGLLENEVHALLDYACDPGLTLDSPWDSQVLTGIEMDKGSSLLSTQAWFHKPLFRNIQIMTKSGRFDTKLKKGEVDYAELIQGAHSQEEAGKIIAAALAGKLANSLSIPVDDIDTNRAIHAYGVDSLVAIELKYWFMREIQADVSVFEIMHNDILAILAFSVAEKSGYYLGSK